MRYEYNGKIADIELENVLGKLNDGDILEIEKLSDIAHTADELISVYDRISSKGAKLEIRKHDETLILWVLMLKALKNVIITGDLQI